MPATTTERSVTMFGWTITARVWRTRYSWYSVRVSHHGRWRLLNWRWGQRPTLIRGYTLPNVR
jgi:hypothetical protein